MATTKKKSAARKKTTASKKKTASAKKMAEARSEASRKGLDYAKKERKEITYQNDGYLK